MPCEHCQKMASPPRPQSPCVDIFDDFDDAESMETAFCKQVSEEQYEEDVKSETDKALGELCLYLDQNPEVYARVLRKRKQEDMESAGVVSFMKSKVMNLIHGEQYPQCLVSTADCIQQTNALKAGMCKTFQFSQDLKGNITRHSERLAAKRHAQMAEGEVDNGQPSDPKKGKHHTNLDSVENTAKISEGHGVSNEELVPSKACEPQTLKKTDCTVDSTSARVATVTPNVKKNESSKATQDTKTQNGHETNKIVGTDTNSKEKASEESEAAIIEPVSLGTYLAPPPPPPLHATLVKSAFNDTSAHKASSQKDVSPHSKALTSITNTPLKKSAFVTYTNGSLPRSAVKARRSSPRVNANTASRENSMCRAKSVQNLSTSSRPRSAHSVDGPFLTPMVPVRRAGHKRSLSSSSVGSASSYESLTSIHSEILSSNPVTRLKATQMARSPGGTPVRTRSETLPTEPLHRAIFTAMKAKFKNVKTPSPRSGNTSVNISSNSALDSTFSP